MYHTILKPLLFQLDAEKAHHLTLNSSQNILKLPFGKALLSAQAGPVIQNPRSHLGLTFRNPLGLAAGMDKDARYLDVWDAIGFGFVELGTVTPLPQAGNPKPRLFRLKKDRALINRMGFNNDGLDGMIRRLSSYKRTDLVIGGNIGKNKVTPNEDAWTDYVKCFNGLQDLVDYFVINVSSPNTPGLRALQEKEPLKKILDSVQELNKRRTTEKPILLKIAPDVNEHVLSDIIDVVKSSALDGMILNNTTIDRSNLKTSAAEIETIGNGGLSGAPLTHRSNALMQSVRNEMDSSFVLIGVGGIMSGSDAQERLASGADLIQVYSGLVYGGPGLVHEMNKTILNS